MAATSVRDARLRRLARLGLRVPATLALIVVTWVVALTLHRPPAAAFARMLMSVVDPSVPVWLGVATVALLTLGVAAEQLLGSLRYLVALAACHLAGVALTELSVLLLRVIDARWAHQIEIGWSAGPVPALAGALVIAAHRLPPLWRRRVWVVLLTLVVTVVLFDGDTSSMIGLGSLLAAFAVARRMVGRRQLEQQLRMRRREARLLVALITASLAVGPLIAAFSATALGPLAGLRQLVVTGHVPPATLRAICRRGSDQACALAHVQEGLGIGGLLMALLPSLLLIVVAVGLIRGRRAAWLAGLAASVALTVVTVQTMVVLPALAPFTHPTPGVPRPTLRQVQLGVLAHLPAAVLPLALVALLVVTRRLFQRRAPRRNYVRLGLRSLAAFLAGVLAYLALGGIAYTQWLPQADALSLLHDAVVRILPLDVLFGAGADLTPTTVVTGLLFDYAGPIVAAVVLALILAELSRDTAIGHRDPARMRQFLHRGPSPELGWMTTWPDFRHWFAPDGSAAVGFQVHRGTALTVGEPIPLTGDPGHALLAFSDFCDRAGVAPVFYSVGADFARRARELGWHALQVAEDATVPLGSLEFKGKAFQDLRTAMNRAAKSKIEVVWTTFPEATASHRAQVREIVGAWGEEKALPELTFTLGGLRELNDPEVRCELVVDEHDQVHAVASWLPVYADGAPRGWVLDVMRRHPDGFRPAIDFLIAKAALQFQAEGAAFLSLSASPLATVDRDSPDVDDRVSQAFDGVLRQVGRALEPLYGFSSLLTFKAKFKPDFQPLYLVYNDVAQLPRIAQAVGSAYLPDGVEVPWAKVARALLPRGRDER